MNERIQELAKQANIEFTYDPTETPLRAFAECWEDELEKFAELIVRECARVYWNIDQSETHTEYVNDLKKHFGVEE